MATILLVEDDNNLREIYEARLQAEGYEIVSAHDGEEALVVAKEKKPNLIIADIMMPKISGFEMLDILKNTAGLADVKIIMLTALGQVEDQQKASKLGADRYLVKSQVTLEDIVNAAHELLEDKTPAAAQTAAVPAPASPAPEPAQVPPANVPPIAPPTSDPTPSPASTSASVDDKLIDDAVNSLGGNVTSTVPELVPTPTSPEPSLSAPTDTTPLDPPKPDETAMPTSTMPTQQAAAEPAMASPTPVNGMPPDNTSPLEVSKDLEERLKQDSTEMETPAAPAAPMGEVTSTDHVPLAPPPEQSSDYLESTSGPQIESTPGSSMKIIKPIPSEEKKDIGTLLEQEGLSDAANGTPSAADTPSEPTDPDTPQVIMPSGSDEGSGGTPAPSDVAL